MPHLVVVTGPIASGKSVIAAALADRLEGAGLSSAVVDLDDVVVMAHAPQDRGASMWAAAREVHAGLVGQWLTSGVDAVIAHGPFHTPQDWTVVLGHVPTGVVARRVLLLTDYETALERAVADPSRGLSRDPAFLRSTYDTFYGVLPSIGACEWTFDTTTCTPVEVVDAVAEGVLGRGAVA